MNREDIIRMAKEAGAIHIHGNPKEFALAGNKEIERFAALVASAAQAKEREACAKVCEQQFSTHGWAQACIAASAIRARGQV